MLLLDAYRKAIAIECMLCNGFWGYKLTATVKEGRKAGEIWPRALQQWGLWPGYSFQGHGPWS